MTQIRIINGKWNVNLSPFSKMSKLEKSKLNDHFINFKKSTLERFRERQNENIKRIIGNQKIVEVTKVFDDAFAFPIK